MECFEFSNRITFEKSKVFHCTGKYKMLADDWIYLFFFSGRKKKKMTTLISAKNMFILLIHLTETNSDKHLDPASQAVMLAYQENLLNERLTLVAPHCDMNRNFHGLDASPFLWQWICPFLLTACISKKLLCIQYRKKYLLKT